MKTKRPKKTKCRAKNAKRTIMTSEKLRQFDEQHDFAVKNAKCYF